MKFVPFECKDYCEPTGGILKSTNKADKVYDVQNTILRTNLLFDESTNIENIVVTSSTIRFQKRSNLKFIRILDLSGQLIKEMDISKFDDRSYFTMNVVDLINGIYQLQIVSDYSITKQLLIHK